MSCAAEMAKLARSGRKAEVIDAMEQLVEGRLTQKESIRHASRKVALTVARPTPQAPVRVRVGRLEFCQYQSRGTSLRIEFRSEEQRIEAEAVIAAALQDLARRKRERLTDCASCLNGNGSACDAVCPMRLKPRNVKRWMFACTQCGQCVSACDTVNRERPEDPLLRWVSDEEAKRNEARFSALSQTDEDAGVRP